MVKPGTVAAYICMGSGAVEWCWDADTILKCFLFTQGCHSSSSNCGHFFLMGASSCSALSRDLRSKVLSDELFQANLSLLSLPLSPSLSPPCHSLLITVMLYLLVQYVYWHHQTCGPCLCVGTIRPGCLDPGYVSRMVSFPLFVELLILNPFSCPLASGLSWEPWMQNTSWNLNQKGWRSPFFLPKSLCSLGKPSTLSLTKEGVTDLHLSH